MLPDIRIIGGGQLGLKLALAANRLGHLCHALEQTPDCPASAAAAITVGNLRDAGDVYRFGTAGGTNVIVTYEIEDATPIGMDHLRNSGICVRPSPGALGIVKDKLDQKLWLRLNTFPTTQFLPVASSRSDIERAAEKLGGYPLVLKARHGSYDGRGNARLGSPDDIEPALAKLKHLGQLYAEAVVDFQREVSVVIARDAQGNVALYPMVETRHTRDICDVVIAPAPMLILPNDSEPEYSHQEILRQGAAIAKGIAEKLGIVGVMAVEMFQTSGGLLVNELALRVHNSAHWTTAGAITDQFTQHILAITDQPLGDPTMKVAVAVMINILGERDGPADLQGIEAAQALPGVTVHVYGKQETRVDRKMGDITVVGDDLETVLAVARDARRLITI